MTDETSKTNDFSVNEFRRFGGLQEVNRVFFHPLGLALYVQVDAETGEIIPDLDATRLGLIHTDDPEGFVFDVLDVEKLKAFKKWKATRAPERLDGLGFKVQKR